MDDLVEVEVSRLVLQQRDEAQYVHLRVLGGDRAFPIVIGFFEALEMQRKLLGHQSQRPLTHDLVGRILHETGWNLLRVVVASLDGGTFYAVLELAQDDEIRQVDCRPSDAIALSIQCGTPVFVSRAVLDEVAPEG